MFSSYQGSRSTQQPVSSLAQYQDNNYSPINLTKSKSRIDFIDQSARSGSGQDENIQVFLRVRPINETEIRQEKLAAQADLSSGLKWVIQRQTVSLVCSDGSLNYQQSQSPMKTPSRNKSLGTINPQAMGRTYQFGKQNKNSPNQFRPLLRRGCRECGCLHQLMPRDSSKCSGRN